MDDYFYFSDGSGYPYDEYEYDEDYEDDLDYMCQEYGCILPAIDCCGECGAPLCHMHSEIGAGFCRDCPTENFRGYDDMSDPAPDTPILPEDAPEGVPAIILVEIPILPPVIVVVPGKDDEEKR